VAEFPNQKPVELSGIGGLDADSTPTPARERRAQV
jgi:hypothetical protein